MDKIQSTNKKVSDNNDKCKGDDETSMMDSTWSWVVLAVCMLGTTAMGSSYVLFGLIYQDLIEEFQSNSATVGWVGSIFIGCANLMGIACGLAVEKVGCRIVCIIGSLLCTAGFFLSFYATSVIYLYVTYGIMAGTGMCMMVTACNVNVMRFFEKKRPLAGALISVGYSIGSICVGPVMRHIFEIFLWRGSLIIFSCLTLQMTAASAFTFGPPVIFNKSKQKVRFESNEKIHKDNNQEMKPMASNRNILQQINDVINDKPPDLYEDTNFTIYTIDSSIDIKPTPDFDKITFFTNVLPTNTKSISMNHNPALKQKTEKSATDQNIVDATDQNDVNATDQHVVNATNQNVVNATDQDVVNRTDQNAVNATDQDVVNRTDQNAVNRTDQNVAGATDQNVVDATNQNVAGATDQNVVDSTNQNVVNATNQNVVDVNSDDIIGLNVTNLSDENENSIPVEVFQKESFRQILADPIVVCFLLSCLFMYIGVQVYVHHFPSRAYIFGVDRKLINYLPITYNAVSCLMKFVSGFIANRPKVNRLLLFSVAVLGVGLAHLSIPLFNTFSLMMLHGSICGLFTGIIFSLYLTVMVDLKGLPNVTKSTPMAAFCFGAAGLLGTPFAGFVFDSTKNYDMTFMIISSFVFIGSAWSFLSVCLNARKKEISG